MLVMVGFQSQCIVIIVRIGGRQAIDMVIGTATIMVIIMVTEPDTGEECRIQEIFINRDRESIPPQARETDLRQGRLMGEHLVLRTSQTIFTPIKRGIFIREIRMVTGHKKINVLLPLVRQLDQVPDQARGRRNPRNAHLQDQLQVIATSYSAITRGEAGGIQITIIIAEAGRLRALQQGLLRECDDDLKRI